MGRRANGEGSIYATIQKVKRKLIQEANVPFVKNVLIELYVIIESVI